jgi:hypothetical protein
MGITQTNALARELLSIIERRIAEKRQADPKLDYGESWRVLASERPDLMSAYNRAAGARPKADCRDLWALVETETAANLQGTVTLSASPSAPSEIAHALVPIETQIHLKQHENPGLTYGAAWKQVEGERPELISAYHKAAGHSPQANTHETLARSLALIDEQIRNKRQANQTMTYPEAWNLVEKERPDLLLAYNAACARNQFDMPAARTAPLQSAPGAGPVTMSAKPLAQELQAIDAEISARRGANPRMGYGDAWAIVARERPELIRAYNTAAARAFVRIP